MPKAGEEDMWELPHPHVVTLDVQPGDIDVYEHVNNAVYLIWLDRAAWAHSSALGVSPEKCAEIRRGMAAHRIEIDYARAAVLGDRVAVGTWIVASDGRLRVTRRFQVRHERAGDTLARARTEYVCVDLDTGRATRMPELFTRCYIAMAPHPPPAPPPPVGGRG
ncbi:MAG: acyl-CoA thioesterase [Steroidobacteraceae bacterium]